MLSQQKKLRSWVCVDMVWDYWLMIGWVCGWVISRRVGRGWFRTPALYSRGEGGLNWCLLFITKLLSFWLSPSSWMYIKYCVKYMWVELRTKNDTFEEPISDDTNIQINKSSTLCAEVSKAVIFNCLFGCKH